jgi:uncharacterized protein (TIGR02452 family)
MPKGLNRNERRRRAEETVRIATQGSYEVGDQQFTVERAVAAAIDGTVVIPASGVRLSAREARFSSVSTSTDESVAVDVESLHLKPTAPEVKSTRVHARPRIERALIEVCDETTIAALHRLASEGHTSIGILNFASARNPGGGFLRGSLAQEESLAISSCLYACQTSANGAAYYDQHKTTRDCTYSDTMIYSPKVTFFRDDAMDLCPPIQADVLTACAVNAGVVRSRGVSEKEIHAINTRRIQKIVRTFAVQGCSVLILGAFGCGVFKNSPKAVAEAFKAALSSSSHRFERVVFAIPGQSSSNFRTFQSVFKGTHSA